MTSRKPMIIPGEIPRLRCHYAHYEVYSNNSAGNSAFDKLHKHDLNCKDEPDEDYKSIFYKLEKLTFKDIEELKLTFLIIYQKYFKEILSFEEFERYMKKKYCIVEDLKGYCSLKRKGVL